MNARGRVTILAIVLLIAQVFLAGGSVLAKPLPATSAQLTATPELTQAAQPLTWPTFGRGAVGAVGYDGVLAEHGDQGRVPIASVTKTVTALVVLDKMPIADGEQGPSITLTDADVEIYNQVIAQNGSSARVVVGATLTQRQMLEALMLPSANNYSIMLADWAYGSLDAFLVAANNWLTAKGLTDTYLADSSGLSPKSVSSPANLVEIGKLVLANPVLASVVKEKDAVLPSIGQVSNTNKLLGLNGVIGLKTGTTPEAGACLLFAAEMTVGDSTVTVVGVILGAPNHKVLNDSILTLLGTVNSAFHSVTLATPGQEYGSYSTPWGAETSLVSDAQATAIVWQDTPITLTTTARRLTSAEAGENVGTLTITVGEQKTDYPLTTKTALEEPDTAWRLAHPQP